MQTKELSELIIVEIIVLFAIGLVLQGFVDALIFALSYFLLFFLPGLPMHGRFEGFMAKFVMINIFGLLLVPLAFFIVNLVIALNIFMFAAIPIIIGLINLYVHRKSFIGKKT
jgi:hypothetical protein